MSLSQRGAGEQSMNDATLGERVAEWLNREKRFLSVLTLRDHSLVRSVIST